MKESFGSGVPRWISLLVFAAAALAFAPALNAPLLYDDIDSVEGNPSIRQLWPGSLPLSPPPGLAVSGRPVVNYSLALSHAFNDAMSAPRANATSRGTTGHHIFNLAFHLACGALLFGIARRTIRSQRYSPHLARASGYHALALTAIWLLHPIQTEAVNYIVQRTELLVSLFILGMLYCWIRAWGTDDHGRRVAWRSGAVAACAIGMGCKEVMAVAPLIVLAYDRAFHVDSWRALLLGDETRRQGTRRSFYVALFATTALLAAIVVQDPRAGTVGFGKGMAWYEYLYTQAWAIGHYLRLTFLPFGQSIDYGQEAARGPTGIPGLIVVASLGALTIAAWMRPVRWGWAGFLGTWFFFILAPSSSFVPILTEVAAERRFYLPLAAVVALIIIGASRGVQRLRAGLAPEAAPRPVALAAEAAPRRVALGGLALALIILLPLTVRRSRMYAEPESLYREAIEKRPGNVRAYGNLAALLEWEGLRMREAVELYRSAIAIDSNYAFAWFRLAEIAIAEQRFEDARDILSAVHRRYPESSIANARLGYVLGTLSGPDEAIPYLERAAGINPTAQTLSDLGHMYAASGRLPEAANILSRSLDLDPGRAATRSYLGFVLIGLGESEMAIPHLQDAARREPRSAITRARLALAYADTDRRQQALAEASSALDLAGEEARVYSLTGMALSRAGYLDQARQVLGRAVEMDPADSAARAELEELRRRRD